MHFKCSDASLKKKETVKYYSLTIVFGSLKSSDIKSFPYDQARDRSIISTCAN